ncbi:MAG: hypothetical protein GY798_01490 [Hyphomicrobiales bacterium]|nr:hypothetical protein [Hyphomicrobiales bacterium]
MNCDNVIAFRMMLRDGRTVKATGDQNADLFWAVRGGTGSNFGILVDVTYRLHPMSQVWGFGLAWSRDSAPRALTEVQNRYIRTGGPSKLGFLGFISNRFDIGSEPMPTIRGLNLGSPDEGRAELAALMEIGDPIMDADTVQSYPVALQAIDETPLFDIAWDKVTEDKQACYIDKPVSEAVWSRAFDYFADAPDGTVNVVCLEAYGGAIAEIPSDACAFVHRSVDFDFFVDTFWTDDTDAANASAWLDGFMALMAPYSNGQVYQNYPRRGLTDTNRRYFGANYDRLLAVKNKYDPRPHMFHFEQGICTGPDDPGAFINGPPAADSTSEPIVYEPHNRPPGERSDAIATG